MGRSRSAADRLKQAVPLSQVLADYGYRVEALSDREQQFSCDLHGDGQDRKPSARLYENQFFCFACGRSRDVISLVQEKEGLEFWAAVRLLEKRYGLEPIPWERSEPKESLRSQVERPFRSSDTPEKTLERVGRFVDSLCKERAITPQKCAGFWEAHDRVQRFIAEGGESARATEMAHRILDACKKTLGVE